MVVEHGKLCRIQYEVRTGKSGPRPGDMLVTSAGSAYLVKTSRRVKRRVQGFPRYALECLRCNRGELHVRTWSLVWDSRSKRQ